MNYIHFESIDSTNDYILNNIKCLKDKTVVFSDIQTKGKGRNNRVWYSPRNKNKYNLYVSVLLLPDFGRDKNIKLLQNLPHYNAVILHRVFLDYGIISKIKWPNDILVSQKKIAGILCESIILGDKISIVVGTGVNLNMTLEQMKNIDKDAISLSTLLNKDIDRDAFLKCYIDKFFREYLDFANKGFPLIYEEYKNNFLYSFDDRIVVVDNLGKVLYGRYKDIDKDGRLILNTDFGDKIINVGDVFYKKNKN